jgi:GalNAc-alpha-(1->4)-GalNAc-alpha-(1->3)-diNAcBac-PP-undecaprenol alpha-1,4-N-acetyl-D-galactosaminyltransferase
MMNFWARKGWEIVLMTSDDGSQRPFYDLHPSVRCIATDDGREFAGLARALVRNIGRVLTLRKHVRRSAPDCVIAVGDIVGIRVILATWGLRIPVLVAEHSDPAQLSSMKNGQIWNALRFSLYPLANKVVVLNQACKDYFPEYIQKKTIVIPNAVPEVSMMPHENSEALGLSAHHAIVTLGRLVVEKRFDLLLKAFSQITSRIDNNLVIVGDGPLRKDLELLVESLGLSQRVFFTGTVRNPWSFLKDAEFFVMSSEVEGFPMVLLEALACGIPVISFDCRTGPREIIRDGIDGILVPPLDVDALAREMERLATDGDCRSRMAERAVEVGERFSVDVVMADWEVLLQECCLTNFTGI